MTRVARAHSWAIMPARVGVVVTYPSDMDRDIDEGVRVADRGPQPDLDHRGPGRAAGRTGP